VLKLAVPTGDLRAAVARVLTAAGLRCDEYAAGSRALRLRLSERADVALRVFREKDIPIQVALGNYDLGICSAAWVEELQARYPQDDVMLLRPLDFGHHHLVVAAAPETLRRLGPVRAWGGVGTVRIVSEFPGIAERFARRLRLARYVVLPVWGAAEAYPPEDADLAVLAVQDEAEVVAAGLEPVYTIMDGSAWLIGSRRSLAARDLSPVLGPLLRLPGPEGSHRAPAFPRAAWAPGGPSPRPATTPLPHVGAGAAEEVGVRASALVRLALPDGHAQRHTYAALRDAGLVFEGYGETTCVRRPVSGIEGLEVKVIRPQDMPQQVALGHFDLAITGRDWLLDHRYQFPSSPVVEVLDLGRSRYTIAAAVSEDVPAETLAGALAYWRAQGRTVIRVASEYPNIADHFARWRHLGRYRIVPVNGASEAFVPEDSEILIEGSETGASFRANRLKVIERVFESTNCVIARAGVASGPRQALIERLLEQLRSVALTPGKAGADSGPPRQGRGTGPVLPGPTGPGLSRRWEGVADPGPPRRPG
jgi:ATP phosphoribosyltransferase